MKTCLYALICLLGYTTAYSQEATLTSWFNKNPDDLAEVISQLLEKSKLSLETLDDNSIRHYDDKGNKTEIIKGTVRTLGFSDDNLFRIKYAWLNEEIEELEFVSGSLDRINQFLVSSGSKSLPRVVDRPNIQVYKGNKYNVSVKSSLNKQADGLIAMSHGLKIQKNEEKPLVTSSAQLPFQIDHLTIHTDPLELKNQLIKLFEAQNLRLLVRTKEEQVVSDDRLRNYSQEMIFQEGFSVTHYLYPSRKNQRLIFSYPNPIAMLKLKKMLNINGLPVTSKTDEITEYKKGNLKIQEYKSANELVIYILPDTADTDGRLALTTAPPLQYLLRVAEAFSGNVEGKNNFLSGLFLTGLNYNARENRFWNDADFDPLEDKNVSFFRAPDGSVVLLGLISIAEVNNNIVVRVSSRDTGYLNQLKEEFNKGGYTSRYIMHEEDMSAKQGYTTGWKEVHFHVKGLEEEREKIAKLNKQEADEKRRVLDEQYRAQQVERAKRNAETIQSFTNSLQQLLNKNN